INGEGGHIAARPFSQTHGSIESLGFRFGPLVYSCDLSSIPDHSLPILDGVEIWILDALRYKPHPSHLSLAEALEWVSRIKPKRAILTNLHSDLDYNTLRAELPSHVQPAFDGMQIVVDEPGA